MIDIALKEVVSLLNTHIGQASPPEVILGNISLINTDQYASSQDFGNAIIASVVNIEQDAGLQKTFVKAPDKDGPAAPAGYALNIYILFSAHKPPQNYGLALQRIGQIIQFFQKQPLFQEASLTRVGIEKLVMEIQSANFEQLSHLWSINGGKYLPSVLYKMRMHLK